MKTFYPLIILFFACTGVARCQDNQTAALIPDVTNNFAISVIARVTDVVLAANIAQSEQVTLANFFQNEATSINNAVNNNATPGQLQALQNQLIAQFQAILTPQELALYSANRKGSVYAVIQPASISH